jgi:tRNA-dihydrouridine synthase C
MPRLILAPMQGLLDHLLRDALTQIDGYSHCVTEFARVTGSILPRSFYKRISPELQQGGRTAAGTEVRVQMLGSDPAMMAANARVLVSLVPPGIDLNFGCPAPTVNRHRGGAVLLEEPELLHRIAAAVRAEIPASIPFSAKMRLGLHDSVLACECAQALEAGGVEELVVHARTRDQGYQPPAHWREIAPIREAVAIPVVANGDIWTVADWLRCREESGCEDVMLGRSAVADPLLARRIHAYARGERPGVPEEEWQEVLVLIARFWQGVNARLDAKKRPGRLKQWLMLLERTFPQAVELCAAVKLLRDPAEVDAVLGRCPGFPARLGSQAIA